MVKISDTILLAFILTGTGFLFALNLVTGPEKIPTGVVLDLLSGGTADNPAWSFIVESRLNRSYVALASGGALALAGLILQGYFRNPLAGPDVLGISSGASLGVALVVLGGLSLTTLSGGLALVLSGIGGALLMMILLLSVSRFIRSSVTLLVAGLMFGYFSGAIINVLFQLADQHETRAYVVWTLGSFEVFNHNEGLLYLCAILICSMLSLFVSKALNALVLGNEYASSSGISLGRTKLLVIGITGLLAGIVTVYCGPVSFIGVAVPQLVRMAMKSRNHLLMIPAAFILGGFLAIASDIIVRLSGGSLPLNTVTAMVGAPVIIWTLIKMNRRAEV